MTRLTKAPAKRQAEWREAPFCERAARIDVNLPAYRSINIRRANRHPPQRRAISLFELLVAFAVGSLLMGLAVGGFDALMQFDRQFSDSRSQWSQQARFVESLRADAHQSTHFRSGVAKETQQPEWIFSDGDREVARYSLLSGRCLRTVARADDNPSVFALPEKASWTASTTTADAGELVELRLAFEASPSTPAKEFPVVILLGRDSQFVQEPTQ